MLRLFLLRPPPLVLPKYEFMVVELVSYHGINSVRFFAPFYVSVSTKISYHQPVHPLNVYTRIRTTAYVCTTTTAVLRKNMQKNAGFAHTNTHPASFGLQKSDNSTLIPRHPALCKIIPYLVCTRSIYVCGSAQPVPAPSRDEQKKESRIAFALDNSVNGNHS